MTKSKVERRIVFMLMTKRVDQMMNHEEKWLSIFKLCEYRAKRNAIKACANSDYSVEDTTDNFMLDAAYSFDKNRASFVQNLQIGRAHV